MKTVAALIALAAVASVPLAWGVNGGRSVEAAGPAQMAPTCQNVQLLIRPHSGQGAAGTLVSVYRIHNLSGQACSLYGYPGVQLLSGTFVTLPTTTTRGGRIVGSIRKQRVTLAPGGNAYFTMVYSDVPVNNGPCYTARYLMVFAPNNFLPVVTYATSGGGGITACNGALNVSPVTRSPRF